MKNDKDTPTPQAETKLVPLVWSSARIANDGQDFGGRLRTLLDEGYEALGTRGVYAIEGQYDGGLGPMILYVGQAGARTQDDHDGTKPAMELLRRIPQSVDGKLNVGGGKWMYSDVWEATLRWAAVPYSDVRVTDVESLLIRAHAPPFNATHVRSGQVADEALGLVIMNGGEKGRLLPSVVGRYYDTNYWKGVPQLDG